VLTPAARRLLRRLGWGLAITAGSLMLLGLAIPLFVRGEKMGNEEETL